MSHSTTFCDSYITEPVSFVPINKVTDFHRNVMREDSTADLWLRDLAAELLARHDPNLLHPHWPNLPPPPPPANVQRPPEPKNGGRSRRDDTDLELWAREVVDELLARHDPNMLHPHWPNDPPPPPPPKDARPPVHRPQRTRRGDEELWARMELDKLE